MVRKALSAERICMRGRSATCNAAGVHEVIDETMSGARVGRVLHKTGRIAVSLLSACQGGVDSPRGVHLGDELCSQEITFLLKLPSVKETISRDHAYVWVAPSSILQLSPVSSVAALPAHSRICRRRLCPGQQNFLHKLPCSRLDPYAERLGCWIECEG